MPNGVIISPRAFSLVYVRLNNPESKGTCSKSYFKFRDFISRQRWIKQFSMSIIINRLRIFVRL